MLNQINCDIEQLETKDLISYRVCSDQIKNNLDDHLTRSIILHGKSNEIDLSI